MFRLNVLSLSNKWGKNISLSSSGLQVEKPYLQGAGINNKHEESLQRTASRAARTMQAEGQTLNSTVR